MILRSEEKVFIAAEAIISSSRGIKGQEDARNTHAVKDQLPKIAPELTPAAN